MTDNGGTRCVVEGCEQNSDGSPITFNEATVSLCGEHHTDFDFDFDIDRLGWDGELSDDGTRAVRLWKREGIGSAS